jgi:hypothetical protein
MKEAPTSLNVPWSLIPVEHLGKDQRLHHPAGGAMESIGVTHVRKKRRGAATNNVFALVLINIGSRPAQSSAK